MNAAAFQLERKATNGNTKNGELYGSFAYGTLFIYNWISYNYITHNSFTLLVLTDVRSNQANRVQIGKFHVPGQGAGIFLKQVHEPCTAMVILQERFPMLLVTQS